MKEKVTQIFNPREIFPETDIVPAPTAEEAEIGIVKELLKDSPEDYDDFLAAYKALVEMFKDTPMGKTYAKVVEFLGSCRTEE